MEVRTSEQRIAGWVGRFFHVLIEPRSYLNAIYLAFALPLGLTYFAVFVVGSIVGALLALLGVGLLILLACLVAAWLFALFERELAIVLLGASIPPLALPEAELLSPWQLLRRHLQQPTTWRSLAFLLVKLPFGVFATFLTFAFLLPCVLGIAVPIGDIVGGGIRPGALAALIFPGIPAVIGLAVSLHILNAIGRAWGRFAADMLGVSAEQHQVWEAQRRAARADLSRRELIMNVSHELRTPVATIQAHLDSMLLPEAERLPTDEMERRLRVTATETRRLADLIEDLLMLARADSQQLAVTNRTVPLEPLLRQVVDSMAPLARQEREVTLRELEPIDGLAAVADPDRLSQVMSNLVRNAINYTPAGGVVSIRAEATDADRVLIAVSDTGIGISSEDLEHVFDRFYRTDGSRARASGGFGLGLAIARELVEAMGGSLTATSEPGLGSTFWLSLRKAEIS